MPSLQLGSQAFTIVSVAGGCNLTLTANTGSDTYDLYSGLIGYALGPLGVPGSTRVVIDSIVTTGSVIKVRLMPFSTNAVSVNADFTTYAGGAVYFESQVVAVDSLYLERNEDAGGDLDDHYPDPTAVAIHETSGPTRLVYGTIPDGFTLKRVGATVVGVNAALGAFSQIDLLSSRTIAAPVAISTWNALDVQASTLSLAAGGVAPTALSLATFAAPTITSADAKVITTAATVTIAGPPVAAGGATITNPLALQVLGGRAQFLTSMPGTMLLFGECTDSPAWCGVGFTSPLSTTNYALLGNSTYTLFNVPSGGNLVFRIGNSDCIQCSPTLNTTVGGLADAAATRFGVLATKYVVSAAGAVWDGIKFAASTLTLTGATTPVTALSFFTVEAPTITSASAITVASAATVTIQGPPVAAGSTTITAPAALVVASGNVGIGTTAPSALLHVRVAADSNLWVRPGDAIGGAMPGVALDILNDAANAVGSFALRGNPFTLKSTSHVALEVLAGEVARATANQNLVVGATTEGATAAKCLVLSNNATAPSASADLCHLYSADAAGAGTASLAIWQEYAAYVGVGVASTHKVPVVVNGTTLYLLATTVQ